MFGLLPTGRAPRGDDLVVSVFWSIRADRVAAFRARGLTAWRAEAIALDPRTAPILDQITDIDQLMFTQYRDVRMRRWHGERIVFLGDAAHATSPQLGQGANLALWDAMCLADAFADQAEPAAALAAYTATRRRHLNYYQLATRALTPLFQSDSRMLGWLRDLVPDEPMAPAAAPPHGPDHGGPRLRHRPPRDPDRRAAPPRAAGGRADGGGRVMSEPRSLDGIETITTVV